MSYNIKYNDIDPIVNPDQLVRIAGSYANKFKLLSSDFKVSSVSGEDTLFLSDEMHEYIALIGDEDIEHFDPDSTTDPKVTITQALNLIDDRVDDIDNDLGDLEALLIEYGKGDLAELVDSISDEVLYLTPTIIEPTSITGNTVVFTDLYIASPVLMYCDVYASTAANITSFTHSGNTITIVFDASPGADVIIQLIETATTGNKILLHR